MAVSALLNGIEESHSLIASRALSYGDGLFETIAYRDGSLRLWDRHMDRLVSGCERLYLDSPNLADLKVEALAALGERANGVVKILISRTTAHRGYSPVPATGIDRIVQAFDWPDNYALWQSRGIKLGLCKMPISDNATLAGIKHLNRLEQVLAAKEVAENGWDEGLMCASRHRVICGTKSNLFTTRNSTIYTPALSLCGVAGVMRAQVIKIADEHGLTTKVKDITTAELNEMDGMFISNALIGVVPISEFSRYPPLDVEPKTFDKNEIIESLKTLINT